MLALLAFFTNEPIANAPHPGSRMLQCTHPYASMYSDRRGLRLTSYLQTKNHCVSCYCRPQYMTFWFQEPVATAPFPLIQAIPPRQGFIMCATCPCLPNAKSRIPVDSLALLLAISCRIDGFWLSGSEAEV